MIPLNTYTSSSKVSLSFTKKLYAKKKIQTQVSIFKSALEI